jgi:hypothetical protein
MANQLDLLTVVRNMLDDVREKTAQLADAQVALEASKARLSESQKDLRNHIRTLNELATEITSELSSTSLAEVKEEAVADSLSDSETAVDETLKESAKAAKTAASDESPETEVEPAITVSKSDSGQQLTPELAPVDDDEADDNEAVELAPKTAAKAPVSNKKTTATEKAVPEKKAPVVSGLWDDDDDDAVF